MAVKLLWGIPNTSANETYVTISNEAADRLFITRSHGQLVVYVDHISSANYFQQIALERLQVIQKKHDLFRKDVDY